MKRRFIYAINWIILLPYLLTMYYKSHWKISFLLPLLYSINSLSQSSNSLASNAIYTTAIDIKPEFPEGIEKLKFYLNETISDIESKQLTKVKAKLNSKSIALFVIEKDGSLSDIKILGQYKLDSIKCKALITKLKSLPKWNPGKQNGQIVRVLYPLPL